MARRLLLLVGLLLTVGLAGSGVGAAADAAAPDQPSPSAEQTTTPSEATTEETPAPPEMTPEEKADADIGKSAAEELEKKFKVVEDSPDLPRINAIIEHIRPLTEKPRQVYHAKVLDTKALNAFSLPGGYIYFTEGLLRSVESDDELAAVAAHEMAHVCLSHSRKMMSRSDRYSRFLGPLVLASILSRSETVDPGAIAVVGSLVLQDALNHYGREAELEADSASIRYLRAGATYNPVAMLTVAEGLARIENSQSPVTIIEGRPVPMDPGVAQTHPYAPERVQAIERQLNDLGIPIERRRVTKSLVASAAVVPGSDPEIGDLRLNDRSVFQPAAQLDGASPLARAQQGADTLNSLLLADLRLLEITLSPSGDREIVRARGRDIITISPADAAFHNTTVKALAQQALNTIRIGFQQEKVTRAY